MEVFPTPLDDWRAAFSADAGIILLAIILDQILPEPPATLHPVVWIGRSITAFERVAPHAPLPAFAFGAAVVILLAAASGALAWAAMTGLAALHVVAYVIGGALLLWTTFAVRGLVDAAARTQRALESERLDHAREQLISLVSRERASLSPALVSAAAIESVAENTTDSFISPWLAFGVFGLPAAAAYRVVNTFDSMWGKRGRYEYLGKFPARLDDVLNYLPARLSAVLMLAAARLGSGSATLGWRIMRRDQHITESPNAGWTMSAMAGLLGRRLEKADHYNLGGEFPPPAADDIGRGNRIALGSAGLGAVAALALLALRHWALA